MRTVSALPKASRIGELCSTRSVSARARALAGPEPMESTWARYFMQILVASVFPAPDSPDTRIDCEQALPFCSRVRAACATG